VWGKTGDKYPKTMKTKVSYPKHTSEITMENVEETLIKKTLKLTYRKEA